MTGRPSFHTPEIVDQICERLSAGDSVASIEAEWQDGLAAFQEERQASLLY